MTLACFAYGSNLDRAAMATRCPGATVIGPARLPGHRLAAMREGWLTVVPDPARSVLGLLWSLPEADVAALDAYEDVTGGLYRKRGLPVSDGDGCEREALVYVGTNAGPGRPRPAYLDAVLAAAAAAGLPDAYTAEIAALRWPAPAIPEGTSA